MTFPFATALSSSGATVVIATGRLNFPEVDALRRQLESIIDSGATRVVVDLSGVEAIDSSGIGALIAGLKAARSAGGDLRLAATTGAVAGVLYIMNLDKVLVSHVSSEEAFPHSA